MNSLATIDAAPPGRATGLHPPDYDLLLSTGWLEWVKTHLDLVEYYDYTSFDHPYGPAVGLATWKQGLRCAQIAIRGYSTVQIASVIVHEAGHFAGHDLTGEYADEAVARAAQARFFSDVSRLGLQW